MSRAGRKRKGGARTASGQLSRARAVVEREHEEPARRRAERFGLSLNQAMSQKAATALGRMALRKQVDTAQYLAGQNYLAAYHEYQLALKSPNATRDGEGGGGGHSDRISEAYADWCADSVEGFEQARAIVQTANCAPEHRGRALVAALDFVVLRDVALVHMFADVAIALEALVRFYGLTGVAEASHNAGNVTVEIV